MKRKEMSHMNSTSIDLLELEELAKDARFDVYECFYTLLAECAANVKKQFSGLVTAVLQPKAA